MRRPPGGRTFRERYGPWALVTGAAEGLGAAFARSAGARGLSVVLVDRKADRLTEVAAGIATRHGVGTRPVVQDLAEPGFADRLDEATADLEVGLVVCAAGLSLIGELVDQTEPALDEILATNCRSTLLLARRHGRTMAARGRGGLVIVSSMSALQGTALVAAYAATKAFDLVLGEALWEELGRRGVDVLVSLPGPTRTPGWERSRPRPGGLLTPRVMEPEQVVEEALDALGRGRPSLVAGAANRAAALLTSRLMPRGLAVRTVGSATRRLYSRS